MEARIADFRQEPISDKDLQEKLIAAREIRGMKFSAIAEAIGISRTALSQFANNALPIREPYRTALIEHLNAMAEPPAAGERRSGYKQHLELYQTTEFRDAIGWCQKAVENRKMGVMIGYPGSGKATILRQFEALTPGARYIECWPGMRMSDPDFTNPFSIACRIVSFSSSSRISSVIRVFQNFVSRLGAIIYLPATGPENTCTPYPSARWISAFRPINHTAFSKATA